MVFREAPRKIVKIQQSFLIADAAVKDFGSLHRISKTNVHDLYKGPFAIALQDSTQTPLQAVWSNGMSFSIETVRCLGNLEAGMDIYIEPRVRAVV